MRWPKLLQVDLGREFMGAVSQLFAKHGVEVRRGRVVIHRYQSGELEGGRRRAIDPVWSLTVHRLGRTVAKPGEPVLYYLQDCSPRGFAGRNSS